MNLRHLLNRPLQRPPISLVIGFAVVALVGFADAAYLTIEHYRHIIPPCSLTGSGCSTVLTSAYSTVFGVPVALIGALYYLAVLVGTCAYLESKNLKPLRAAILPIIPGFVISLFLLIIQAFVLHSYCLYCLGSALITTILFVLTLIILLKKPLPPNP